MPRAGAVPELMAEDGEAFAVLEVLRRDQKHHAAVAIGIAHRAAEHVVVAGAAAAHVVDPVARAIAPHDGHLPLLVRGARGIARADVTRVLEARVRRSV